MPITTAPSIWLRPASGLMMRPASMTVTTRLTRSRAISGCHVTSTKWQPNECVENFGLGLPKVPSDLPLPVTSRRLARRSRSANGTPLAGPSALTKTRPPSNARSSGLRFSNGEPGVVVATLSSDSIACRPPRRRPGPPTPSPSNRPRSGRAAARCRRAPPRFCRAARRSSARRAARGSCTCRCRCPGCRRRRGPCRRRGAGRWPRRRTRAAIHEQLGHSPAERQAVAFHRADLGRALRPAELLRAELEALDQVPRRERDAFLLVDFRLVEDAELDRIDLELVGQFVHGRLGGVEPRHARRGRACRSARRRCVWRGRT